MAYTEQLPEEPSSWFHDGFQLDWHVRSTEFAYRLAVDPPDIDRINALTRRLDDICREAQTIRAEIKAMALVAPSWPDVEEISRHSRDASSASDFIPPDKPPSDTH